MEHMAKAFSENNVGGAVLMALEVFRQFGISYEATILGHTN